MHRSAEITAVAAGDRIDMEDVLGRPARRVQFIMTDAADTIDYTLNNLTRIHKKRRRDEAFSKTDQVHGIHNNEIVEVWSAEGLNVSSIQIDALSLGTGTTITIICW